MPGTWRITGTVNFSLIAAIVCVGCQHNSTGQPAHLLGAGSSFDKPFFAEAFKVYTRQHPAVSVDYQPVGSGLGAKEFLAGLVDFGASDVPLNSGEISAAERTADPVIQVPVALGAAALAYHIEGVPAGLKVTTRALAGIFLGKIRKWNDPELKKWNPSLKLPDLDITVVHRLDGSGTTYIFTDYISKISPEWKDSVGTGKVVNWPVGVGSEQNSGVASVIARTPGAIGYVELAYVLQNRLASASVQNAAGNFVMPSLNTVMDAASQFASVDSTNFTIVNAPGASSYPICGYSWALIYRKQDNPEKGQALVDLMKWLVNSAQDSIASRLGYAPLPKSIRDAGKTALERVQI